MPTAVEAIYYTADCSAPTIQHVQNIHTNFLLRYQLDAAENPLLVLDRANWDAPFRAHTSESETFSSRKDH